VLAQVRNGVSVRMAALYLLLSGDTREPAATLKESK
jgi:aspartate carbamoyltransferase catalytic subunit